MAVNYKDEHIIDLIDIVRQFDDGVIAVDNLNLYVGKILPIYHRIKDLSIQFSKDMRSSHTLTFTITLHTA